MRRRAYLAGQWLLVALCCACVEPQALPSAAIEQPIELAEESRIFALSSQLLKQRGDSARQREYAARATGALLIPFVDANAQPAAASNGTTLRASCGVTFVSPSFAVTAAHCVDDTRMDTRHLTVKMFRPTLQLGERFGVAAAISGTYPDYTHPHLTEHDGYFVDEFACNLVSRCSDNFGGWLACHAARDAGLQADVALIQCPDAPANRYETLAVTRTDDPQAAVFLPWKHEIYTVATDPGDDRFQHYARYYDDPGQNYHYFDRNPSGQEQNQLLPLVSIPFADGVEHRKLSPADLGTMTDLFGCHGTSGAGVLQPNAVGVFELLGPVVRGNHELEGYLCNHDPSYDGFARIPGSPGLIYGSLEATRTMLIEHEATLGSDCASIGDSITARFAPRPCALADSSSQQAKEAFAPLPLFAQSHLVAASQPLLFESVPLRAGAHYRVGFSANCSGDCATLRLTLGGQKVLSVDTAVDSNQTHVSAAPFAPADTATSALALSTTGTAPWTISTLSVVEEGKLLDFDSATARVDVLLLDLQSPNPLLSPLRLEGTLGSGFCVRIEPQERLVFTRQALLPEQATNIRFKVDSSATLACGLLSVSGTVLSRLDCSTGFVRLDANAEAAAFFIENASDSSNTNLDDVSVVSDSMPDSDGDRIPDLIDDCPRGPLPPQGELVFTNDGPDLVRTCSPLARSVTLKPPELANSCEPATLHGYVSTIGGEAVAKDALVLMGNAVTLPVGTATATYDVLNTRWQVVASLRKQTQIVFDPTSACCHPPQRAVWGNSTDEAFDYSAFGPICAFTGGGSDFVASGSGSNYVTMGADNDYVSAHGSEVTLIGGDGDDYLSASSIQALVFGGPGDDTIHALGTSASTLYGGPGRDVIVAGAGSDTIIPGSGGDWVDAGAGDDEVVLYATCDATSGLELHGGLGSDTLRTPLSADALARAGVVIDGFETVIVDDSSEYLSDCFAEGTLP